MTFASSRQRGGFRRRIQLSLFIRDYLSGQNASAHDIYIAYKTAVQSDPSTEYLALARRRIRSTLARAKRTYPHQRVKVTNDEIEANMDNYKSTHPIKGKKHCCTYNSFLHYIYVLKRLGLIEETGEHEPAAGKGGSNTGDWHDTHQTTILRIVGSGSNDPAWQNIWQAYLGQ